MLAKLRLRLRAARNPVRTRNASMAGSETFASASIQGCASSASYHSRCRSGQAKPSANMQWPTRMAMHASARMPSRGARLPAGPTVRYETSTTSRSMRDAQGLGAVVLTDCKLIFNRTVVDTFVQQTGAALRRVSLRLARRAGLLALKWWPVLLTPHAHAHYVSFPGA